MRLNTTKKKEVQRNAILPKRNSTKNAKKTTHLKKTI